MAKNVLALKPFLETIKTYCVKLTKKELIDLLCQAALDTPAEERRNFLEKLSIASVPSDVHRSAAQDEDVSILAKTDKLLDDVAAWQKSIEDGSYYEKHWEDGYCDEEEFPSISKEQQETLETLFAEADGLFLDGKLELAGNVYQQLIDLALHSAGLDYGIDHNDLDVNWRETLARYCRCVYETSADKERVKQVLSALEVERKTEAERQHFGICYNPAEEIFPSLRDVFDVRPGELADWNNFLKKAQKKLHGLSNSRAVLLYLETVYWLDGIQGLAAAVRQRNIPVGYLYWLDMLRDGAAWNELAQAAHEALHAMPHDALRGYAAAQLSLAGEQTSDNSLVLQGKREQFFSEPQEEHLAALLRESAKQQVSEAELSKTLAYLEAKPDPKKPVSSFLQLTQPDLFFLKIKTMLLLGKLRESYAAIDQKAAIGWSDEKKTTGAVYVGILLVLSQGNAQAKTIHSLFAKYMRGRYGNAFIADAIQQRLLQFPVSDSQKDQWLKFVEQISAERAEHIISNQYRKGYARAAEALGGYLECLLLHERRSQAAAFLNLKRNQQYKRYPAFRRELDEVISRSPLLTRL
ncbi:MAG: hypothetical protein CDV28_102187 [Candidatus Electronema aureum]|uniref:Uncharacterized protein n=1 Tax=Candidatus Electronema aureum TaxID=2005002 RepID=A0A521G4W8_9BACT|nr:MAG: hypothetical protein CDV28_102187 [Candidatus Electronema aureum]